MSNSRQLSVVSFQLILTVISAILLVLSFPNFNIEILAWVGLVPLLFAIEGQSPKKTFLLCYLFGVIFFLGTIYWLVHVTLPGMIAVVLYQALYFGLFGWVISKVRKGWSLAFVPAAWVAVEWLRSNVMTGFGWNLLAHSQSFTLPVIQIADIFGAYGVSFLVVSVNIAIYLTLKNLRNKNDAHIPLLIAVSLIFLTLIYGYHRLNNIFIGEKFKVAVIQGNIAQSEKWDNDYRKAILKKYAGLTRQAAKENCGLIVWPETAVPGVLESEEDLLNNIGGLAIEAKTPLLVGTLREAGDNYYNSATLISADGTVGASYDKIHLVPFGEYIPFKDRLSFVQKFARMPIGDVAKGREYKIFNLISKKNYGDKDRRMSVAKKIRFSCLICFEDIFPQISREFVKRGSMLLLNMTNDAWYKRSSAPYQHAQASIFRAIENRVNVARAANTGYSCFIDQKGKVIGEVGTTGKNIDVDGFKACELTLSRTKTLYNTYGDLFAYICIAFSLIYLSIMRYNKN